ncbi:hypothetical protein GIB67_033206 [Kingdonia uniflora]|uniref:RING-CH-type domain-containing protein n=1 Tax=Kingdonia uniflora TaxID=39325 RepID=A0A7J7MPJ6_9MAGN|nr:hypothetical protein GIB67_033206 [Kingdonia uniflora]
MGGENSSRGDANEDGRTMVTIVISDGGESGVGVSTTPVINESGNFDSVPMVLEQNGDILKTVGNDKMDAVDLVVMSNKGSLSRSGSSQEQCRVCQQQEGEDLIDLGCKCRGGLAKVHRSCIDTWFRTKGSNKCEICQEVASNVQAPDSQPSRNYWVWRTNPALRGSVIPQRPRGCFSPLWVAFSILIGGLLLDVLISVSLGVNALPVNVIIGVLVVLGLGTALRLALECCYELNLRRTSQRSDTGINLNHLEYHPSV